ncbi:hypothetical protein C7B61_20470 [filamentous cyanobacterium CCP1]|nr:hypothetical protein C7B76_03260 [filamentous cyanobacterium CCP2]PSB56554.1 hypothetical protein C7B61_20470 [filamentous cyanobacterium CCP1]
MTYSERLNYWAVVRLLPTHQWVVVARFHSRSDADGYCQFLQRQMPNQKFMVVFDLPDFH